MWVIRSRAFIRGLLDLATHFSLEYLEWLQSVITRHTRLQFAMSLKTPEISCAGMQQAAVVKTLSLSLSPMSAWICSRLCHGCQVSLSSLQCLQCKHCSMSRPHPGPHSTDLSLIPRTRARSRVSQLSTCPPVSRAAPGFWRSTRRLMDPDRSRALTDWHSSISTTTCLNVILFVPLYHLILGLETQTVLPMLGWACQFDRKEDSQKCYQTDNAMIVRRKWRHLASRHVSVPWPGPVLGG